MEMWNNIAGLKALSHYLTWAAAVFAIMAALATGVRYYVDRHANDLSLSAQKADTAIKEEAQHEREAALKLQVEEAQRLQQEAAAKLSDVEQKVKGRHLSSEQNSALTTLARNVCSSLATVPVTAANSNHEAQVYADEFVKALKRAGCKADLDLPIPGLTPDVVGIHIGVRDPGNISPGAIELSKILSGVGVQFSISRIKPDFFPEASFVLVIGAKP